MTGLDLINAAIANRQKRLAQVSALRPVREVAKEKAADLGQQVDQAKRIGAHARFIRSLHHVPGFFPTPPAVVARMVEAAELAPGMRGLEPSAGTENLLRALVAAGCTAHAFEIVPAMCDKLRKDGFAVEETDFLDVPPTPAFDRVLMNPPFEKRQDEEHTRHAFGFLAPCGRLVACVSSMTALRMADWVRGRGRIEPLPEGSFKYSERPTGVHTSLVIVDNSPL